MKDERILIVEDENDVNRLLATILSDYQTTSAFSGTEAKLYLASAKYDLVLLDLMLPGMTGEEIIDHMRGQGIKTPVIVISAKQEVADRVNVLRMGAEDADSGSSRRLHPADSKSFLTVPLSSAI